MGNGEKNIKHGALTILFALFAVGLFMAVAAQPALAAIPPEGIMGKVTDANGGLPIQGLTVQVVGLVSTTTDAGGNYWLAIQRSASFVVQVSGTGWVTQTKSVTISLKTGYGVGNFAMVHQWGFYGRVTQEAGFGISGPYVEYTGWIGNLAVTTTTVSTNAYGYYWAQTSTSPIYKFSSRAYSTSYFAATRPQIYIGSSAYRQDFVCQSDVRTRVVIAELFCTASSTTRSQMSITFGSGGTNSVTVDVAGSGFSASQSWTTSVTYPGTDKKSMVIWRDIILTGTYSYATGKVTSCSVRTWLTPTTCDFTQTESPTSRTDTAYAGINTVVDNLNSAKGGLCRGIQGNAVLWINPFRIDRYASSSLTFSLGTTVSFGAYGVSATVSSQFSWGSSSSTALSVQLWNTDTAAHTYKWFLEGLSSTGGVVLHVWDMGRT